VLIDGLAGVAILGIAYSLYRYLEQAADDRLRRSILVAGVLAGATSFVQTGVGVTLVSARVRRALRLARSHADLAAAVGRERHGRRRAAHGPL
jgi:hypothetical protein